MPNLTYHPLDENFDSELASVDERPDSIRRKAYLLNEGVSCVGWFPKDVSFKIEVHDGAVLTDFIPNRVKLLLVSNKAKAFLQAETEAKIEFLPIHIVDGRGVKVGASYFIANVLNVVSCVDTHKSEFASSALDKAQVHHFKRLALVKEKIPQDIDVFRLGEKTNVVLFRSDLVEKLNDNGLTGVRFMDIDDFGAQYRPVDRVALAKQLLQQKK